MPVYIAVVQMLLVTCAVLAGAYLFLSLKRDLFRAEKRRKAELEVSEGRLRGLEKQVEELKRELESLPAAAMTPQQASGINMNKRTQALRMMRLGEGPEHIAAALGVPRKEVELLVKVQRLLIDSSNATS